MDANHSVRQFISERFRTRVRQKIKEEQENWYCTLNKSTGYGKGNSKLGYPSAVRPTLYPKNRVACTKRSKAPAAPSSSTLSVMHFAAYNAIALPAGKREVFHFTSFVEFSRVVLGYSGISQSICFSPALPGPSKSLVQTMIVS